MIPTRPGGTKAERVNMKTYRFTKGLKSFQTIASNLKEAREKIEKQEEINLSGAYVIEIGVRKNKHIGTIE